MDMNMIAIIGCSVAGVGVAGVALYRYLRGKALSDIRADVYQLFLKAEHVYTETEAGKKKMDWVIGVALTYLPAWAKFIVTEEVLRKVVQKWFDAVKDLLDDGKYNKSTEE